MMYGERSNGKEHGVVLTKPEVVEKMLDLAGFKADRDLRAVRVIEPSAGEGAFALPLIRRLYQSSQRYSFDFNKALQNLKFYDIDRTSLDILKGRVLQEFEGISEEQAEEFIMCGDFLTAQTEPCDLVIGNPPYIRHENIPNDKKEQYKKHFTTFIHRSDIYIPFYEKGLKLLRENGRLCYICANRWLKNQYGKRLRTLIAKLFSLEYIIDLENVDAFEESVIAYPAITTIQNTTRQSPIPYYQLDDLESLLNFSIGTPPSRTLSNNPDNWFARDYHLNGSTVKLSAISEQGFKIGIGVATGRDKVFIGKDMKGHIEETLLLPILLSKDVRGQRVNWSGNYLLNPYTIDGNLIDLGEFPKAKAYLFKHYEQLVKRHVAKKNPKNWYRTIDKVHAELTHAPKIILPDITGNPLIHIDQGNYYPHHNLYYITGKEIPDLELLAAILMSDFVRDQLLELGNKMNGGYPRWQSQNLKKLRIPYLDALPNSLKKKIRKAYRDQDTEQINEYVNLTNFFGYTRTEGQLALFEPRNRNYLQG